MSRGGLRFKSKRKYPAFIQIEVAAPYAIDSYNIFEGAQIVFVQELPEQQKYRYGVQYLKSYSK
jgi:hypothetical protein